MAAARARGTARGALALLLSLLVARGAGGSGARRLTREAWAARGAAREAQDPHPADEQPPAAAAQQRPDAYGGALWAGPHAAVVAGEGYIWLQHVRKAGGTTLCAMLRQNYNATPHDCLLLKGSSGSLASFGTLEAVAAELRKRRLEAAASAKGSVPLFGRPQVANARGGGNSAEHRWAFLTIMRDPVDRLVSSMNFVKDKGKTFKERAEKVAENAGRPPPSMFDMLREYGAPGREPIRGCRLDNYNTRVFSGQCDEQGNITREHFEEAAKTVKSYDICFVTEWLHEMAPLMRYLLGAEHLDAAPRNYMGVEQPAWGHGRTDFMPSLGRTRAVQRGNPASHAALVVTPEELAKLRKAHEWDMQLYDVCKRSARALARSHLFVDDDRRRRRHAA